MSDQDRRPDGSENGKGIAKRVGNAERDEAIVTLQEHWDAGRLDPGEHELRVTRARAAVTQSDLDDLFVDLPERGRAGESSTPQSNGPLAAGGAIGFLEGKRETIMALTPFAAMVLFFTTGNNWVWFLMVPVMGVLVYGPDGGKHPRRGRRGGGGHDHDSS